MLSFLYTLGDKDIRDANINFGVSKYPATYSK